VGVNNWKFKIINFKNLRQQFNFSIIKLLKIRDEFKIKLTRISSSPLKRRAGLPATLCLQGGRGLEKIKIMKTNISEIFQEKLKVNPKNNFKRILFSSFFILGFFVFGLGFGKEANAVYIK
jgi:hypothetical protein